MSQESLLAVFQRYRFFPFLTSPPTARHRLFTTLFFPPSLNQGDKTMVRLFLNRAGRMETTNNPPFPPFPQQTSCACCDQRAIAHFFPLSSFLLSAMATVPDPLFPSLPLLEPGERLKIGTRRSVRRGIRPLPRPPLFFLLPVRRPDRHFPGRAPPALLFFFFFPSSQGSEHDIGRSADPASNLRKECQFAGFLFFPLSMRGT